MAPRSRRRGARKIALETLYEHEIGGTSLEEILERYRNDPSVGFAAELVRGVEAHRSRIDDLLSAVAEEWAIERMPVIDRSLLRIGLFEILYRDDIPVAVTIDEAVELAKTFSTEDSGRFINGILSRVASDSGKG